MHPARKLVVSVAALVLASPAPALAQRTLELGLDAGAVFGLGDVSSIDINLPGSRFRVGYFPNPGSTWSLEPAAALSWNKVEDEDGIFTYDLELGALYHFRPFVIATTERNEVIARLSSTYVRPFVGFTGFTGGGADDNEFSAGAGIGLKVPWRRDLAWRLEANLGYGFDNDAARIGLLAGLSFFSRSRPR
ncbi:MAG: hypothetical protein ACJ79S_16310 [Gemmatimonadaceae bacterium]